MVKINTTFLIFVLVSNTVLSVDSGTLKAGLKLLKHLPDMIEISAHVVELMKDSIDLVDYFKKDSFEDSHSEQLALVNENLKKIYSTKDDDSYDKLSELIIKIHFDREVEVPTKIVEESIFYTINNPSHANLNYLNQSCQIYRQKDLLYRFHNIIIENELYFLSTIKNFDYISTKKDILYQKLVETLQKIIANHGICNSINGVAVDETINRVKSIVGNIQEKLNEQINQINNEYFTHGIENYIKKNVDITCQFKENKCNKMIKDKIEMVLKEFYQYGDEYYVLVNQKSCQTQQNSSDVLHFHLDQYNILIHKSKPVYLQPYPRMDQVKAKIADAHCRFLLDKKMVLSDVLELIKDYFHNYTFLSVCEKDINSGIKLAEHVTSITFNLCGPIIHDSVTIIYGNSVNNGIEYDLIDKYTVTNQLNEIESNIDRVKNQFDELIMNFTTTTTITSTQPSTNTSTISTTTTMSTSDLIKKFASQVAYLLGKKIDTKLDKIINQRVQNELNDTVIKIRGFDYLKSSSSSLFLNYSLLVFFLFFVPSTVVLYIL